MSDYRELDELKARLDSHRPIEPSRLDAVREKFRLEWTYHSNALEGNPLTLSETSFFIREGLTSKGKPLQAYLEAKNHIAALDFLEDVVRTNLPITESLIKQYHALLFERIDCVETGEGAERRQIRVEAGQYKRENNYVIRLDGKILNFTDWLQVPGEIERLISWYESHRAQLHPIELAAGLHHKLVSIHPFVDGNGRASRLLMNTILMQHGFTPAIIPIEEKKTYLEALQSCDEGQYQAFYVYLEELASRTLRLTIDVVEGREAFDFEDLSRMFKNIAARTRALEQELGPGSFTLEQRSSETAEAVGKTVFRLLQEHANKTRTPEVPIVCATTGTLHSSNELSRVLSNIQEGRWNKVFQLQVQGQKRFVPQLTVDFIPIWGRYQTALVAVTRLGKFSSKNVEQLDPDALSRAMVGSIYSDDWDSKEIEEFVLTMLKDSYKMWDREMDRRKSLIAEEEAEVAKFRKTRE